MKIFANDEVIISMENVRRVNAGVCSPGRKDENNYIFITYTNDREERLYYGKDKDARNKDFKNMKEILEED